VIAVPERGDLEVAGCAAASRGKYVCASPARGDWNVCTIPIAPPGLLSLHHLFWQLTQPATTGSPLSGAAQGAVIFEPTPFVTVRKHRWFSPFQLDRPLTAITPH